MIPAKMVRVSTTHEPGERRETAFWIVATGDAAEAERTVRERVGPSPDVEATAVPISPETLDSLKLAPGQAWLL